MNFLTTNLDEDIPNCRMCGNKPRLICKTLDTKRGETVRVFLCKCDETTRTSRTRAFSSEADTGSREENASKQKAGTRF
jgi:hypothetical protein